MEITFLGHQGWCISHGDTHVLIDPILCRSFGHCESVQFEIFPPREILVGEMPNIAAVFISHEHLDHFHLNSLALLRRNVPVYVGELMPLCVVNAIETLGFAVHRTKVCSEFHVGELCLTLFPASCKTIFWEKRVHQVLARPADGTVESVFIAVDALSSDDFLTYLTEHQIKLRAAVCTNNSQVVHPQAVGSHSNLLPVLGGAHQRLPGLQILHSILIAYLEDFPAIPDLIFCGNGFVSSRGSGAPFLFSDHDQLAVLAQSLALDEHLFGPLPGQCVHFGLHGTVLRDVSWIQLDKERWDEIKGTIIGDSAIATEPICPSSIPRQDALQIVEQELPQLASNLLSRNVGILALSTNVHLSGPVGAKRILLRLLDSAGRNVQYALDFSRSEFVEDATPTRELLQTFPFGVEMHLQDFAAVLDGRMQIWDLAGCGMRSWFVGDKYHNITSALFEMYGEQLRPDLARVVYAHAIKRLMDGTTEPRKGVVEHDELAFQAI